MQSVQPEVQSSMASSISRMTYMKTFMYALPLVTACSRAQPQPLESGASSMGGVVAWSRVQTRGRGQACVRIYESGESRALPTHCIACGGMVIVCAERVHAVLVCVYGSGDAC